MDKYEWIECLIHLDVLKSSVTEKVAAYILTKQEAMDLFLELKRKTVSLACARMFHARTSPTPNRVANSTSTAACT